MSQTADDLFLEASRADTYWGNAELALEGLESAKELYEAEGDLDGVAKCEAEIANIKAG